MYYMGEGWNFEWSNFRMANISNFKTRGIHLYQRANMRTGKIPTIPKLADFLNFDSFTNWKKFEKFVNFSSCKILEIWYFPI